ncbi:hypothetical protein C8Q77DRAFT_1158508 [Trametes polyzona]|nr:hypothetical protein C8Q77DRAFT_1158508 [Trametes polyzona]
MDGHEPGNIHAALCDTGNVGEFHWVIYLCTTNRQGYKFHAHNKMNTEPWRYHTDLWDGMDSRSCIAFTKIGRLAQGQTHHDIDAVVRTIPMAVPDVDRPRFHRSFTCLVWFREALRRLHTAGIIGVVDLAKLEEKLVSSATATQYRRLYNLQPREPVIMSPSEYTF